jgi:hypothetical protein
MVTHASKNDLYNLHLIQNYPIAELTCCIGHCDQAHSPFIGKIVLKSDKAVSLNHAQNIEPNR